MMPHHMSAADGNRQFSEILGQAANGETIIIARRGTPVGQIIPIGDASLETARELAWTRLRATLDEGLALGDIAFDRDGLHDR